MAAQAAQARVVALPEPLGGALVAGPQLLD
jgi:hypothetical protein